MNLPYVFGLNYNSSTFKIRQQLAFTNDEIPLVLSRLQSSGITKEVVILSTCNRTEIYCLCQDIDFVINAICDIKDICPRTVRRHCYIYSGEECANHLFRVVSGLDSMVLGESEIVSQVKDAWQMARDCNTIGTMLAVIFQMSLSVQKEVRTHTEINNINVSMGSAVKKIINQKLTNHNEHNLAFIGAGQMMTQIAPHFRDSDFKVKTVFNRNADRGELLANRIDGEYKSLELFNDNADSYSVIILCTGGGIYLDDKLLINKNKIIIDLSMPILTDLSLKNSPAMTIVTIDDIAEIVDVGIEQRKLKAELAEKIIENQIIEYQNWLKKRGLTPVIRALRDHADDIRLSVLSDAERRIQNGDAPVEVIQELSIKLTNKLLHAPTVNLCAIEDTISDDLIEMIRYLYSLDLKLA